MRGDTDSQVKTQNHSPTGLNLGKGNAPYQRITGPNKYNVISSQPQINDRGLSDISGPIQGSQLPYSPTTIDTYKKPNDLASEAPNYLYGN